MNIFETTLSTLVEEMSADFYMFSSFVDNEAADNFIHILNSNKSKKSNCCLLLTTNGGDPDAGYRIMRAIRRLYAGKIILYIFGRCKSTGTLMCYGADEIVMGIFGEMGPLDIQLTKDDQLSKISGLDYSGSLSSLSDLLFLNYNNHFRDIMKDYSGVIKIKTAADVSACLALGLLSPITEKLDPLKFGEVARAASIARNYAYRLNKKLDAEQLDKLASKFPSHSFVIDYSEAQATFSHILVREPSDYENILSEYSFEHLRSQSDRIEWLKPQHKEADPVSSDEDKTPVELSNETGSINDTSALN